MNSKKIATAFILVIAFVLMQYNSCAQTDFIYAPGIFSVSLSPINPGHGSPPAFYSLFLETGNGRYIRSASIPDGNNIPAQQFPYSSRIVNSNALLNIIGHYDTTPRPPRQMVAAANNPNGGALPVQNNLPGQKKIGIDYSDTTVVPGNMMTAVLTYKANLSKTGPATGNFIVAFFYNNKSIGGKIFGEITDPESTYDINGTSVKLTRRFYSETGYSSIDAIPHTGIPETVFSALQTAGSNYNNGLYFVLPNGIAEDEKNIFISLTPDNKTDLNYNMGMSTAFSSKIINYNSTRILGQDDAALNLPVNLYSGDPNGISTTPNCLNDPHDDFLNPYNVPVKHTIMFENDGPGDTKKITVKLIVPMGIVFPGQLIASRNINGEVIRFKPWGLDDKNYYTLNPAQRLITFTMVKRLPGTASQRNPVKRRGIISFTLKTNPSPLVVPDCMYSFISIIFTNQDGTNNPAITAWDLIRKNCNLPIACPMLSKVPGDDNTK